MKPNIIYIKPLGLIICNKEDSWTGTYQENSILHVLFQKWFQLCFMGNIPPFWSKAVIIVPINKQRHPCWSVWWGAGWDDSIGYLWGHPSFPLCRARLSTLTNCIKKSPQMKWWFAYCTGPSDFQKLDFVLGRNVIALLKKICKLRMKISESFLKFSETSTNKNDEQIIFQNYWGI